MKGQLNIEFVASILIFALIAAYTAFFIYNLLPGFSRDSETETIRAKAYQISDLLLADPGLNNIGGTNWDENSVKRVGLSISNESYVLNSTKILKLSLVDNQTAKNGFYPEYNMRILVQNTSDGNENNYIAKLENGNSTAQAVNIIRIAPMLNVSDGTYQSVRVILTVWKV